MRGTCIESQCFSFILTHLCILCVWMYADFQSHARIHSLYLRLVNRRQSSLVRVVSRSYDALAFMLTHVCISGITHSFTSINTHAHISLNNHQVCNGSDAQEKCAQCKRTYHRKCLVTKPPSPSSSDWTCPVCEKESGVGLVCNACKTESSDEEEESSLLPCENVACNAMYHRKCIRQMLEMLGRFECTRCSSAEKDKMESFKPTQTEPSAWHGSSQIKKGYGIISDDDGDGDDRDDENKEEVVRKLNVESQPGDWKFLLESNARIRVEAKNPKKEGSKSYLRYEKYKLAKTAKEYLELGGRREDFKYDMKRGFITDLDEKKRIEEAEKKRKLEAEKKRKLEEERKRKLEEERKKRKLEEEEEKKKRKRNKKQNVASRKRRKMITTFSRTLDPHTTTIALIQSNPKRQGTKSFSRFEKYKAATTIHEYLTLGGSWADLQYDLEHDFAFFTGENAAVLKKRMHEHNSSENVEKEKIEKENLEKEKTEGVAVSAFPLALAVPLASKTKKNHQAVAEIDSDKTVSEDEEIAVAVPVLARVSGVAVDLLPENVTVSNDVDLPGNDDDVAVDLPENDTVSNDNDKVSKDDDLAAAAEVSDENKDKVSNDADDLAATKVSDDNKVSNDDDLPVVNVPDNDKISSDENKTEFTLYDALSSAVDGAGKTKKRKREEPEKK